jgi:hypothetical protein
MASRSTPEEQAEKQMLAELVTLASGWDRYGNKVSTEVMVGAQVKYHEIKERMDRRQLERDRLAADQAVEAAKVNAQLELEHRRLDIEAERLNVAKAEVLVKALSVAVDGGADPNALLEAIRGLGQSLLPGALETRLLERKDDK